MVSLSLCQAKNSSQNFSIEFGPCRQLSSASAEAYPRIEVDFSLSAGNDFFLPCHSPIEWRFLTPEEEILFGPACWLWDYLRRSGQGGAIQWENTPEIVYRVTVYRVKSLIG